jgi:hypothetical protein
MVINLKADQFEYHLSTITARNQTHEFELFCRKLCERAICPNLRVQTGPEGGGDSKVDTETLPVAEEIAERYYEGLPKLANETWAFAISAQRTWKAKAKHDVDGIIATGRKYDRIFIITSQHARAKDRAKLEDELTSAHGVPVTIHDRTWLVEETITKERVDLAYNFLSVGEVVEADTQMGPQDYSRQQQLEDIEREISVPENFSGMKLQLVSETIAAARLSRGLERPRHETDGRFDRAIRLAEKYGTSRQKLEARYEKIWTAFWWFDDFDLLLSEYGSFEEKALQSDNALDLEWLGNLHQLLVNSVVHNHAASDDAKVSKRADNLETALIVLAEDSERPNNALEASVGLLRIRLNRALLAGERAQLSQIWEDFSDLIDRAKGLGEFNFDTLVKFVEATGQIAGNDPGYNALVEKCALAVGERKSQGEAALMYLRRAEKLDFEDNFDMIRWLSKAAVGLSKQEFSDDLVQATYRLAVAYRSAGLLWAARASCSVAMATLGVRADRQGDVPIEFVPTAKLWAWLSLELWHLPDALHSIQLMNSLLDGLPLSDDSKERLRQDLLELDVALASLLLNLGPDDLARLETVPDLLGSLGLHMARAALLYVLGHFDALRADNIISASETEESIAALMTQLKGQSVAQSITAPLVLNSRDGRSLHNTILGMRVGVRFDSCDLIPVAETILGVLEAFFATSIAEVAPHAEEYRISIHYVDEEATPQIATDPQEMTTTVGWPRDLVIGDYGRAEDVRNGLVALAGHVLGTSCSCRDMDGLLLRMFRDEAVPHRIEIVVAAPNSFTRVNKTAYAQLSDWDNYTPRTFKMMETRPALGPTDATKEMASPSARDEVERSVPRSHKHLGVRSVIDVPTWDKAGWSGCGYLQMGHDLPPIMAFLFENGDAGRKIFERWRVRFGEKDVSEEIALAIIRNLPDQNAHHYILQVASNVATLDSARMFTMASRSKEMTPANSVNLDRFLQGFARFGVYAIIPGAMSTVAGATPDFDFGLAIEKRALTVRDAKDIVEGEPESVALATRGWRPGTRTGATQEEGK